LSAILLLFLFALSLASPMLSSAGESSLPACCRRAGQHHCSLGAAATAEGRSQSGPALRDSGRCPMYPAFTVSTIAGFDGILAANGSAICMAAKAASCGSFELRVLSYLKIRAHSKRGPPVIA
jgi:hypothetical protein